MKVKLREIFIKYYYLLSAFLMFLSFPSLDIWFLKGFPFFAWVSLVPIFLFVREKPLKEVFYYSCITGLIGNFLTYGWIGDFGNNMPFGNVIINVFMVPYLTLFFISKIFFSEYLTRISGKPGFIIYPSVWIIIDWIQSIGFLAFPWTYWGYSQYPFKQFVQISSITGIMGITFIMIMANFILSELSGLLLMQKMSIKETMRYTAFKRFAALASVIFASVIFGHIALSVNDGTINRDKRISVVQSCISPWDNWTRNRFSYLEDLNSLTVRSLSDNPDIIIWSESATLEKISFDYEKGTLNPFESEVLNIARTARLPLLTGEIGILEDRTNRRYYPQNNAVMINEKGEVARTYPKINLVPFGEWFPYEKWFPFIKRITESFGGSDFVPGSEPTLFSSGGRKIGVLICYEGIFYRLCRAYKKLGAEYFVNITNLGWTKSYAGHMQQFAASVFRAAENGLWYVSASNTGNTALIDPYGRVVKSIPRQVKGYLTADIDFRLNHDTIYSTAGDVILYAAMVFIGALLLLIILRSRRLKNASAI
jgi:apolipoprotein N-acyltransferase